MEFTNITGFIGIIFLSVYFFRQKKRRHLLQEGISTEGTVIDLIEESSHRNGSMIYPMVRFMMKDGTWITAKYSDGSSPSLFKKKEKVNLIYTEEDPESYLIISNKVQLSEMAFLAIGTIFLAYYGYCLLK